MRTIYIYLSWTGWIWFIIAAGYLMWKKPTLFSRAPEGTPAAKGVAEPSQPKPSQINEQ